MADLTCPVGGKPISGNVAGHPELSDEHVPPFCIDETEVSNDSYQTVHSSPERAKLLAAYPEFAGPNFPAVFVNWQEARAYCQAKGGDLPTGVQWEKAARGPQGYEYGTRSGQLRHDEANYDSNITVTVNSYPANGYGLYNMTGNVMEWTLQEGPGSKDYARSHSGDTLRDHRGGAYTSGLFPDHLSVGYRSGNPASTRTPFTGFRCVAPPQDSKK